jgi:hypothetical protein
MAEQQALKCPVCGKSGRLECFSIAVDGTPLDDRVEHPLEIGLCQRNTVHGRFYWTKHPVPLQVKLALRQQIVEALARLDAEIAEEAAE